MKPIRYAVVGLGYISQIAVLPAFKHAKGNSLLTALVSGDPKKLKKLGSKYKVENLYSYEQYDECLKSGEIDAVYIALPNNQHAEYTIRAAEAGIHVLCEKPLAVTERDCHAMIEACERNNVYLMTAYRLHFEEANLKSIKAVQSGKIGEPRLFNSTFSMQVKEGNIRLKKSCGGGPLRDLGIYCINAARYLFQSEPLEVTAFATNYGSRFEEVNEMVSATLKFPQDRIANFTCSFGAADAARFEVLGTKGELCLEGAYELAKPMTQYLVVKGAEKKKTYPRRDQFAPELQYFSDCIHKNREPEPSGREGLADLRVIEAIEQSIESGMLEKIVPVQKHGRPSLVQEIHKPAVKKEMLVHAEEPAA